jgi:hypothetical protein
MTKQHPKKNITKKRKKRKNKEISIQKEAS